MVNMVFDKIIIIVLILESYHQHEANRTGKFFFSYATF